MNYTRREFAKAGAVLVATSVLSDRAFAQTAVERVDVDLRAAVGTLDHIWSRCAGSDRAAITLRESWRHDLDRFHRETGLERVRFHGIFNDELGVWPGGQQPNFQNIDAVYDGLLERGVQPFVELSFMPRKLGSDNRRFGLYGANITPPKSLEDWSAFIQSFVRHLVERYGAAEVRQWYFEVWNEPDLAVFWSGSQTQYFEMYKATAVALKAVDGALRVGGPSTSSVRWIPQFLEFCSTHDLPVDFVSTHLYAGDDQKEIFGEAHKYSQNEVIPAALAQVRAQIDATRYRGAELWLSEWSSDSPAMIAHVLAHCLPFCHAMSQWALSGAFEEFVVPNFILKEGDNGWGMLAQRDIAKPQFNTYKLLHRLGHRRLQASGPALASRTEEGAAVLVWNLADVQQPSGIPGVVSERKASGGAKRIEVALRGARSGQRVKISYVDQERGSPFPAWRMLGSPQYPTREQLAHIRTAAEIAPPQTRKLGAHGELALELPAEGIALIELG